MEDLTDPRYLRAKARVDRMATFYWSLAALSLAGMALPIINLFMGPPWWFFWPLVVWVSLQLWLACLAFGPTRVNDVDWKNGKIREELDKGRS